MRSALLNAGFMPLFTVRVLAGFSVGAADENGRLVSFDVSKAIGM